MNNTLKLSLVIATLLEASISQANWMLIAQSGLSGASDLSTATSAPLENGVAGNTLGGLGSGLAWAGGNTFIATPDRGPNAVSYNSLVDDTSSYITRFQTLNLSLTTNNSGSGLSYNLTPTVTQTTLLSSQTPLIYGTGALGTDATHALGSGVPALNAVNGTNYFTGRSDGFDATQNSANPNNARFDPEGVRVSNDGKSVFISDEYGPYIRQFDRNSGELLKTFTLPANLDVSKLGSTTASEGAPTNATGRVANKGMEGLAITPDGSTLVGVMQAPLLQDAKNNIRVVTIDIASGTTHEYGYKLTTGSGVSEIVALNNHEFLLDERDGKGLGDGSEAVNKQLFKIDLTGATDITAQAGTLTSVSKSLVLDVKDILVKNGISAEHIPAKIEGLAFGSDVTLDGLVMHTLYVSSDNDFLNTAKDFSGNTVANPSMFYVFGFTDADLGGSSYQTQQLTAVPIPSTLWMFGSALVGLVGIGRKRLVA